MKTWAESLRCVFLWQPCAWGSYNTSLCPDTFLYLAELRDYPWFRCRGTSQFAHLESKNIFRWTCNSADFDMFRRFFQITLCCFGFRTEMYRLWTPTQRPGDECEVLCKVRCAYESYDVLPIQSPVSEMVRNRNFQIPGHGGAVCGKSFGGSMQQPANSEVLGKSSESPSKWSTSDVLCFRGRNIEWQGVLSSENVERICAAPWRILNFDWMS